MPEVPHDATVALRLELGRMTDKANALEAALRKEVAAIIRDALFDNSRIIAENYRLKAEVESLTALVESNLNSSKVAMGKADAVLHERDSLKAEVERLKNNCDYLDRELDREIEKTAMLCGQVMRLTKAGDAMADELIQEYGREVCLKFGWFKGWNAAKEGKPSDA